MLQSLVSTLVITSVPLALREMPDMAPAQYARFPALYCLLVEGDPLRGYELSARSPTTPRNPCS